MSLIVQKFGGSSVGTLERIQHVANKVARAKEQGHQLVVVVSAMYGETDRLIHLANTLTSKPSPREYDVLLSTGEQASMALLSMALNSMNHPARSFTASQIGIQTTGEHSAAEITSIDTDRIRKELADNQIVIVAGFQGINQLGDITTLGRGGSDTTAVALAAALNADECQIFTDVAGIYTTDPHLLPEAQLLSKISFEEMLEMSRHGAKVLQMHSVELAQKNKMPIRVLSTFVDGPGTLVTFTEEIQDKYPVAGIAVDREVALIYISNIPELKQSLNEICHNFEKANIKVNIAKQSNSNKHTDLSLSLARQDYTKALNLSEKLAYELKAGNITSHTKAVRLTIVGGHKQTTNNISPVSLAALNKINVPALMLQSMPLYTHMIINESELKAGVRAIHSALGLNKLPNITQPTASL